MILRKIIVLSASLAFSSALTACSARQIVLRPTEAQIRAVPVGSVVDTGEDIFEVEEPSYLMTLEYIQDIMRVRSGE